MSEQAGLAFLIAALAVTPGAARVTAEHNDRKRHVIGVHVSSTPEQIVHLELSTPADAERPMTAGALHSDLTGTRDALNMHPLTRITVGPGSLSAPAASFRLSGATLQFTPDCTRPNMPVTVLALDTYDPMGSR